MLNYILNSWIQSGTTILKWPAANGLWSPPGLDYSKSMYNDHSKVTGDHFFKLFEFEFCIWIFKENGELEFWSWI